MRREDWPAAVAGLDIDARRQLPIPFAAARTDEGGANFTLTDENRSLRCARERLCGVCGKPLTPAAFRSPALIAFLGGPKSAGPNGAYTDPPMHELCAEAAIGLCPYIARPRIPRRSERVKLAGETTEPHGFLPDRPAAWVMILTTGFDFRLWPGADGDPPALVFLPAPAVRVRRWQYQGNRLVEIGIERGKT